MWQKKQMAHTHDPLILFSLEMFIVVFGAHRPQRQVFYVCNKNARQFEFFLVSCFWVSILKCVCFFLNAFFCLTSWYAFLMEG